MDITIPLIVGSAVVDSINPCAFAVLIFLILYLITVKNKKKMLQIGLVYISVVFLVYLAAGLGLLSFIQSFTLTKFFYYFTAGLSIVLGLINIKDYFWYGKGISLAIPASQKARLDKYVKKATLPAAIILGVLVAFFELPCTGGVYLAIISLLASRETWMSAFAYLFFYNLIFIAPLLIILLLAYKGLSPEKIEKWRQSQKKTMRLAIGLVLISLGLLMFLI
ncbi:MAG: Cytochrome c biogenesis protein, transmembrane region [Parcubacteria group bacterium GW2011_GWC2_38_7]|nr:MAG: Cytochrome c biogenesis protein, transmembrane region [Parcubacteria group bacterium GW2011_GWC2_38_7]